MLSNFLVTIAVTYILSESSLLETLREKLPKWLKHLIYCPICTSFWVALLITLSIYQAFVIMGLVILIYKLYEAIEKKANSN